MWFLKPLTTVIVADIPHILHTTFLEYVVLWSAQVSTQFMEGLETLGIATLIKPILGE